MLRNRQFSDVVQQRGRMQSFQFGSLHAQFFGDFDGINADALQVLVGRVILGFNGQRQRLNGSQVQVRHLLHVPLLVFQFAQVEAVGAVDEINRRHQQQ